MDLESHQKTMSSPKSDTKKKTKVAVLCTICNGVSFYNKAMQREKQQPYCIGVRSRAALSIDAFRDLKSREGPPKHAPFVFVGLGRSLYSRELMRTGKHLPAVHGRGIVLVGGSDEDDEEDEEEDLASVEQVLRAASIQREIATKVFPADVKGIQDGCPAELAKTTSQREHLQPDSSQSLRGPTLQSAGYAVGAMIRFWERQLDGFGDRYAHSCRQVGRQMKKQAQSIPQSAIRIMRRIAGRDDDDDD